MTGRSTRGAARLLTLTITTTLALTPTALAEQPATLSVRLTPEHLGAGTTIAFAFKISAPRGQVPEPIEALDLRYPAKLGLLTSGLGLTNCSPATLELIGPKGCPTNSLMGHGNALVEIAFGPEVLHETGQITVWMGPVEDGHVTLLFDAEANTPVYDQLIFTGSILESTGPYGGELDTIIPPIASLPGAPDGAVAEMHTTIGAQGITYYRHHHGKWTPYQPEGLRLPHTCPHPGFPFAATFSFHNHTHTTSHTTVPCPHQSPG
jgi:hypothetical protein